MTVLVLDAGALVALERRDRGMWGMYEAARLEAHPPVVPAPVLGQVWRGGPRQALLSRALAGCDVLETTEDDARAAGVLLGACGSSDVVDALVVVTALGIPGAEIVTSDPHDLAALVAASGTPVVVRRV